MKKERVRIRKRAFVYKPRGYLAMKRVEKELAERERPRPPRYPDLKARCRDDNETADFIVTMLMDEITQARASERSAWEQLAKYLATGARPRIRIRIEH